MAKKPAKKAKKAQKAGHSIRKPKFRSGKKTPRLKMSKGKHVKKAGKNVRKRPAKAGVQKAKIQTKKPVLEIARPAPKSSSAKYKFLEHTADIMVLAQGRDFPSALQQAGLAMFSVLGRAKPLESFEIEETARSRTDLVVYILARILSECDVHELVPAHFDILEYDEKMHRIKAQVWGERIRPKDAIKAVTYHRLEVREEKGLCFIQVVFDV